ncbi:MAG: hypothetical protein UW79_C0009G0035 [Candidatus Yanofskybacteria bacterium GW2011_GWA2_44_9]|uniref:Uncharacterized protein n=1 Tax=Candidatus Yanofskybacteria bacterium GW2011_GWA2_44_9 TaxID=1619025 RepID=A0A0G1KEZ9_9BACT|nr:MAG: hypothetical protein UW79_C0009G0035 [Candidatus Yanofskybacteria bacterium GW2011_GWA2_44_9]
MPGSKKGFEMLTYQKPVPECPKIVGHNNHDLKGGYGKMPINVFNEDGSHFL